MNISICSIPALLLLASFAPSLQAKASPASPSGPRERLLMDFGWRFAFGHPFETDKDFDHATGYFSYLTKAGYGDGPAAEAFDDRSWREVDLPHDWAVELPFDAKGSHSHGYKAIGRNFPQTSVGWYRKKFLVPKSDFGRRISVEFDGIHRDAVVWVNGFYLGRESNGYIGCRYDVTDYLNYGGENTVAVRVDATLEEGWFYEGAGIYRHVWLEKTDPLHVEQNGIGVVTQVADGSAEIDVETSIVNEGKSDRVFTVGHEVLDDKGATVAGVRSEKVSLGAGASLTLPAKMKVSKPRLWSLESPNLHRLVTRVQTETQTADEETTVFGIRTVRFDSDQGFFLNGKRVELKGTNDHQDHAGVGTALTDALQEFRVLRLKEMGSNAIRCSHNPPTPELLEACDRLGMLVLPENRLMGTTPELLDQVKRMILRDRNHPCVIAWSLGNEEWSIEGNEKGARIASTMQAFAKRIDPSRLMTVAQSGGSENGISGAVELMGFNYIDQWKIDDHHKLHPSQPSMGTEESTTQGTRGVYDEDRPNGHMAPTDRSEKGCRIERGWKFYAERPFLSGLFFWTGFDYRGEPNPCHYPAHSSQFGILDTCGFPKDAFYYLRSWWREEPELEVRPHWNWKGREGRPIDVWVYGNCDEVELFLDGKSLGRKAMEKNSHLQWSVPYAPGVLRALGFKAGKQILERRVETTGDAAALVLTADRKSFRADGEDVAVVSVRIDDAKGRTVPTADNEVEFLLEGPGKIVGVGNGDPSSLEPDQYHDTVFTVKIRDMKSKDVPDLANRPEVASDVDDSAWSAAFYKDPKWDEGQVHNEAVNRVIRGVFELPLFTDKTRITFFAKSIGEVQSLYINGHLIAESVKRDAPGQVYILDHKTIHSGRNIYAMAGTPLVMARQWENLNADPGLIQVTQPSVEWKRRAFNGWAQVIVKTSKQPGTLHLKAVSKGLSTAEIDLRSEKVPLHPFVP